MNEATVIVLVVVIFAWCFWGSLALYRAIEDMYEMDGLI